VDTLAMLYTFKYWVYAIEQPRLRPPLTIHTMLYSTLAQ